MVRPSISSPTATSGSLKLTPKLTINRQDLLRRRVCNLPPTIHCVPRLPPGVRLLIRYSPVVVAEDMVGVAMYELVRTRQRPSRDPDPQSPINSNLRHAQRTIITGG